MNRRALLKLVPLAVLAPAALVAARPAPALDTREELLRALEALSRPKLFAAPDCVFMSPREFEYFQLVAAGKPPYLARLRVELNGRRRRAAAPPFDPRSLWAVDRTTEVRA